MAFINPLDSFSEIFKAMGFEIESDEDTVSFRANGAFDVYALQMSYDEKYDSVNFNACFFDVKNCKLCAKSRKGLEESLDFVGNLPLLTSYANLLTSIGCFLNIEGHVCFCFSLPFAQFLEINDKLAKKILDTIVDVCDRFVPGFVIGYSDETITLPKFSQLVAPCMCVG